MAELNKISRNAANRLEDAQLPELYLQCVINQPTDIDRRHHLEVVDPVPEPGQIRIIKPAIYLLHAILGITTFEWRDYSNFGISRLSPAGTHFTSREVTEEHKILGTYNSSSKGKKQKRALWGI